ncbi:RIO1 family regulatory kinase/ATPase domain-containing protein [Streptomyces sp. 6N223]|uniref:RIO1 family regulatory kinase/ATPase domain-containing protein n=1 Tax=Streptomyces sp. 6N223 TaxID=3457412 RepID=UPI003FD1A349
MRESDNFSPMRSRGRAYRKERAEIGDAEHAAAPRLAQVRPSPPELDGLWDQLVRSLSLLAGNGLAHGDLSRYNVLVHDGRLVLIDVPQIVDVISNPRGRFYLTRDVRNIGAWFIARGLAPERVGRLAAGLLADSGLD